MRGWSIDGTVVGSLVHVDLSHGKPVRTQTLACISGEVLCRGAEGQHRKREALRLERMNRRRSKGTLFDEERVVERLGQRPPSDFSQWIWSSMVSR